MYFHLVCSPEFFAVAFSRKSARKAFRRSCELMLLKDQEFARNPTSPPYVFHPCPFHAHIILLREAGNGGVLGSLWVSQTQVVCVRKR